MGLGHMEQTVVTKKRKSRKWPPDLIALRRFAKAIEQVDEDSRRAAIYWLCDYFLGLKLWGRRF